MAKSKRPALIKIAKETHTLSNRELAKKYNVDVTTISRWKGRAKDFGYDVKTIGPKNFLSEEDEASFIEKTFKKTCVELAREYSVSEKTIRNAKERLRLKGVVVGDANRFPPSPFRIYDDYLVVKADNCIVLGDCHVPYHDHEMLELVCLTAEKYGIDTLILSGDFVSLDCFSKFPAIYGAEPGFNIEKNIAFEILDILSDTFLKIYYLSGNHERRILYKLNGQLTFGELIQNLDNVTWSEYPYCFVESGGEKILVCHPDEYRKVPLSLPKELASIHLCHVINGHTHALCKGWHKSGQYWMVEGGHCCDPKKIGYKTVNVNTKPQWKEGFTIIRDGKPIIVDKESCQLWLNLQ